METLYEVIARERRRRFVGRDEELAALDQWLSERDAPTRVFSVIGMGGSGKSTLLLQMAERARRHGVAAVWIDGRACNRTPPGFIEYLAATGLGATGLEGTGLEGTGLGATGPGATRPGATRPGATGPGATGPAATGPGLPSGHSPEGASLAAFLPRPGGRSVWCIDNYEDLESLDGWLRERFFAQFPASGHLVVLATRQQLPDGWQNDPGWRTRLRVLPLEPLTRQQSRTYLERSGVAEHLIDDLVRHAGGLPLALSLAADVLERNGDAFHLSERDGLRAVNARLLLEATETEVRSLLDVLAVVPEADEDLLGAVLGAPVPGEHVASLARLSFVQCIGANLRLHDVARHYLSLDLRRRDPMAFRRMRHRAVHALLNRLETVTKTQRAAVAAALLGVCADALPSVETYADLSGFPRGAIRMATERDIPALQRLLMNWLGHPLYLKDPANYSRLLEQIVRQFPESCRIVTGSQGEPLAFLVAVLLCREMIALIDDVEQGALERHLPAEYSRLVALPLEKADTYLALMVGVDSESEDHTEQQLVGLIIRDGLARLGEGTRALLCTNHPDLERLLGQLGFSRYASTALPDLKHGPHEYMYELDLRSGRFGSWVLSFLDAVDGGGLPSEPTATIALEDVRSLLESLHDAAAWENSPVAAALDSSAVDLRETVKAILTGRQPSPPPLTEYDAKLLCQTYWRRVTPDAIAFDLHISRSTYYRHLRRATDNLRNALIAQME